MDMVEDGKEKTGEQLIQFGSSMHLLGNINHFVHVKPEMYNYQEKVYN